jgi:hypothetical protein
MNREVPAKQGVPLRVRIRKTPIEQEMDGVQLDHLTPGRVCDVSASLGSWLLAEGYAALEMRSSATTDDSAFTAPPRDKRALLSRKDVPRQFAADRRRRDR